MQFKQILNLNSSVTVVEKDHQHPTLVSSWSDPILVKTNPNPFHPPNFLNHKNDMDKDMSCNLLNINLNFKIIHVFLALLQ